MSKRRFRVEMTREVIVEVDGAVLEAIDDEWRSQFYNLLEDTDVAEHLAFNLTQGRELSELDGFATLPDDAARIVEEGEWNVEATELHGKRRG